MRQLAGTNKFLWNHRFRKLRNTTIHQNMLLTISELCGSAENLFFVIHREALPAQIVNSLALMSGIMKVEIVSKTRLDTAALDKMQISEVYDCKQHLACIWGYLLRSFRFRVRFAIILKKNISSIFDITEDQQQFLEMSIPCVMQWNSCCSDFFFQLCG